MDDQDEDQRKRAENQMVLRIVCGVAGVILLLVLIGILH